VSATFTAELDKASEVLAAHSELEPTPHLEKLIELVRAQLGRISG
jgi:hypothetical protein